MKNECISKFRPVSEGFRRIPHHAIVYSSEATTEAEHRELITDSTLPKPIFSVNYGERKIDDPATFMVLARQKLERDKSLAKSRMKKSPAPPEGMITEEMMKYIEISETASVQYVGLQYDYHFTGGNLEIVDTGTSKRLAQATMDKDYPIRLVSPASKFKHITAESTIKRINKNLVYEIMTSESYVGIRRKKTIDLLLSLELSDEQIDYEAPIKFKWSSEITASGLLKNQLIFSDIEKNVHRTDMERLLVDSVVCWNKNSLLSTSRDIEPVSINCVSENVVSCTNLSTLNLVDFRVGKMDSIFDSTDFHMKCEELSYNKSSLHDNLLYLASSHILYGIDLRFPNAPLMHWTHQLIQQPTMLKTIKYKEDEVICLSSNLPGDMKIFNSSKTDQDDTWHINRLPVKPHHAKNSYQSMRENGLLLLSDSVKHRVNLSTTGIAMIGKKSKIELFTQNSIGDIFKSNLYLSEENSSKDSKIINNFLKWDEALSFERNPFKVLTIKERQSNHELHFTDIVKLKGLRKVMRCEKLQAPDDLDENIQMMTEMAPRWKIDLEEAREYRDVLSQHLLNEWNLQIDEERPQIFAEALAASDLLEKKKVDKVAQWLENYNEEVKDEKETNDSAVFEVFSQDLFTQPMTTQPTSQLPVKKKKIVSQRVKGF